MTRRRYTREFKIEAVRLAETSDRSMVDMAQELGIHENTLYKWRVQLLDEGLEAFPGQGNRKASDAEMLQLRRELEQVREERDILKKALVFFSKESK
jgi:transposase-like protein